MKIRLEDQYYMDENGHKFYGNNTSTRQEDKLYRNGRDTSNEYMYPKEETGIIANNKENYSKGKNDTNFNVFLQISDEENDFNRHPDVRNKTSENKGYQDDYYNNINDGNDRVLNEYLNENFNDGIYNNTCDNIDRNNHNMPNSGSITVVSKLGSKEGVELKGAKINLYKLNGISPILCASDVTDCNGRVVFDNLQNGCYRVISIVDRRYFEKPCYITWNEVTIDCNNRDAMVWVVNKIKPCYFRA